MGDMSREEKDEERRIIALLGLNPADRAVWHSKYMSHIWQASIRELDSELTFEQYMHKVIEAQLNTPDQIGKRAGQFQLGRIGDVGRYTTENCRFITTRQNHRERYENGCHVEGLKRLSLAMRGQTKETSERVKKSADTNRGRSKHTHEYHAQTSKRLAKQFELIAPDGTVYHGINLSDFCDKHSLHKFSLYNVFAGRRPSYRGWTGRYITDES